MSRDAVELASLRASLDASQRHVRRVLHVLRALGRPDGKSRCYCPVPRLPADLPFHTTECAAARRELLALTEAERIEAQP